MTTDQSVTMGELTWKEFEAAVDDGPVFLPVGSTEQHGPHLPLNVDAVIAEELATRTAERVGGVVAPVMPYGFNSQGDSGGGPDFVGTTNVEGETLRRVVSDVIGDLVADGAEQIVAINGHFENEMFLRNAIDVHLDGNEGSFIIASWWDLLSPSLRDEIFADVPDGFPDWATEHAGVVETSLMQYFRPELVRDDEIISDEADRSPPFTIKPAPDETIPDTGAYYKAEYGSREIGRKVTADVVDRLVEGIETEWSDVVREE